jgi:S-adenosyl-L-methionine hydrolase (adenosine-forming)
MAPLITLTTDFGNASPYVSVMKGVILSINTQARIVDLTHAIRPQDLRHASYFLATAVPHFPAGTIHVCVVDPGVGSDRAAIFAEVAGQRLLGPDNGIFTGLYRSAGGARVVRHLAERRYWLPRVSDTFHGRDIFAPVAAHLSLGVAPAELGPEFANPVELAVRSAVTFGKQWRGEVQFVDDFGNIISNIPADKLTSLPVKVTLGNMPSQVLRWVRTYAEAAPGEVVCLFSSDGFLEVAEVYGNAARRLGVEVGAVVELEWE